MPDPQPSSAPFIPSAPFIIENRQEDRTPAGTFRPAARLVLTPSLRTGGLWAALPPEDFRNLFLVLTFLTPNGWCRPSLSELADAMGVSHGKAKSRMERLAQTDWRGRPLVTELPRPDGLPAFAPGRQLLCEEQTAPPMEAAPVLTGAGREAVVAHSRGAYATTRAEVERDIAERMGWDKRAEDPPAFDGEDPAVAEAKRQAFGRMTALGIPRDQALDLLARFDLAGIERQLAWLPARHAKSPARFLAAAIEGDYEMPPALRRQALVEAAIRRQNGTAEGHEKVASPYQDVPEGAGNIPPQDVSTIYRA